MRIGNFSPTALHTLTSHRPVATKLQSTPNELSRADQPTLLKSNAGAIDRLKHALDKSQKTLESQDRMGNFEIQQLMSAFNQAETLSSNVQKKMDDTVNGQQQKIG